MNVPRNKKKHVFILKNRYNPPAMVIKILARYRVEAVGFLGQLETH